MLFVISAPTSVSSVLTSLELIVVSETNDVVRLKVPLPFRGIVASCYAVRMSERTPLSSAIHAFSIVLAMMAEDLEKRGAMNRKDFAKRLRDITDDAEATAPDRLRGDARLDLAIARHVAALLDKPPKEAAWTPVVIDGGQQPEGD